MLGIKQRHRGEAVLSEHTREDLRKRDGERRGGDVG